MQQHGSYNEGDYIQRYLNLMLTPGAHGDTWVDESHRTFFNHYAQGKPITGCGDEDQTLSGVVISLPILIHGWRDPHTASLKADDLTDIAHKGRKVASTTRLLAHIFSWIFKNHDIDTILHKKPGKGAQSCLNYPFKDWISKDDFEVIGQLVHPGDQLDDNMPTLMNLALKYQNDTGQALLVNAHSGGDSCHRGAILGALLGALNGVESLPADWVFGLNEYDSLDKISDWLIELQ